MVKIFNFFPIVMCMGFVLVCSYSMILYLKYRQNRQIDLQDLIKYFLRLTFGAISIFVVLAVIMILFNRNYLTYSTFLYEGYCWSELILCWYFTVFKKNKITKNCFFISLPDKAVFVTAILAGLVCVGYLTLNNFLYVLPSDKFGQLGDFYFNSDTHRGVESAIGFNIPHIIHPCYRFLIYPLVAPVAIFNKVISKLFSGYSVFGGYLSAYYLCAIQILFNAISAVLFKRILKSIGFKDILSTLGAILFVVSFSVLWLSILPETYAITLVLLLAATYAFLRNEVIWIVLGLCSFLCNPMSAVACIPFVLSVLRKNYLLVIEQIKEFWRQRRVVFLAIILLSIGISTYFAKIILPYIFKWSDLNGNVFDNLYLTVPYLIVPWFWGPQFKYIDAYFVQTATLSTYTFTVVFVMLLFLIIGVVNNYKKPVCFSAALLLIFAIILHGLLGYGRYSGVIYAPLYGWAAILLFVCGLDAFLRKANQYIRIVAMGIFIAVFCIQNILWINKIGGLLSCITFEQGNQSLPTEIFLSENGNDRYFFSKKSLIRFLDLEPILKNIDGYRIIDNNVIGLFNNSSWFKLYNEGNKLYLDNNDDLTEITTPEDIDKQFFFFGMGLREKYLFIKSEIGYKLYRYSDKMIILSNLTCEAIDAENYTVTGRKADGNKYKIYEDETGIYLDDNGQVSVLDNRIKINIPDFSNYKYSRELKILFNEVMINITTKGPTPNFIAYPEPWYRDGAIMGMVLKETGNISQIKDWVSGLESIYDNQNGNQEPDNIGQVLYLISITGNKNHPLIDKIITEVGTLTRTTNYISGITDGSLHPVYQTRWLIYGLKSLGLHHSLYSVPNISDTYCSLMWFDGMGNLDCPKTLADNNDRWPYLYYARLHFYNEASKIHNMKYPFSYELSPSKAKFNNLNAIGKRYAQNKLIVPHAWSAAEMFLYLLMVQP